MESLGEFIPTDRRQAMASGEDLPDRARGAALFADISGFTPLTEALLQELGPRRGAEELTRQLNLVYDALIAEVHRYRGSVIAFSGDAITCWFDGDAGLRATACSLAMQQAMRQFATVETPGGGTVSLAMKAAVAAGPVRRFRVGDPQIQYIDVLAGATVDRMAAAEHQAKKGEVLVGPEVLEELGDRAEVADWRTDEKTGQRFAVVSHLSDRNPAPLAVTPWPALPPKSLTEAEMRPWLLTPVYERLTVGQSQFLAEIRPAVALFLKFSGLDFDQDEAVGSKLDTYIHWVQKVLARYDSYLMQLTIGDKGSYLYAAFGAPISHDDDPARAVAAALELRSLPPELDALGITDVQIGISQGRIWCGAYGGSTRWTYGVLGDDVNLAARLMQAAAPGQILVSQIVQQAAGNGFSWEETQALKLKGKTQPVTAFILTGEQQRRTFRLQTPHYHLPMVGRETELALIEEKLAQVVQGRGQIVGVSGEAGIGKTRLVAEAIRLATDQRLDGYAGECQSFGTNTSYLVWQSIWRSFFEVDPAREATEQVGALQRQLELIDPALVPRLPLLGATLNLSIPDNDLTRSFDAKLRKTSLESLLVDCLRIRARTTPLLLVLEDCHWLDPLSLDLLEVIGRAIADLPVLLVLAYRPPELQRSQDLRVTALAHFTEIRLEEFTPQEAERLISLKLEQFFDAQRAIPRAFIERITARAEGNPFYIEELLNYLQDRRIAPNDGQALEQLDLPTSLHSLILSRIDQLSESQKIALKVASVIGRLFKAAMLWGVYPQLGDLQRIKADLEVLARMELTSLDTPEPELSYLFKHIVTQEVTYESLPYATRAMLHDQIGQFIEQNHGRTLDQYVDLLAYHFERSQNEIKKREYLRRAGEAAQADYANEAAIEYYRRVLPLLPADEQVAVMLQLGEVLQVVGRWDEASDLYQETLALAERIGDLHAQASCQTATAVLFWKQGAFNEAWSWLKQARAGFEQLGDQAGVAQVLHHSGTLAAQQGDYEAARSRYEESLAIRRQLNDKPRIASLLSNLGIVARYQGDYAACRSLHEEALKTRWELGDKWAIAISLNNLGYLALELDDYDEARTQLEVAVALQREVGDRWYLANALNNLGNVTRAQNDHAAARALYEESLTINRELGDKRAIAYLLEDIGCLAAVQGQAERALRLCGAAEGLREEIGAPLPPSDREKLEQNLIPIRQSLGDDAAAAAIAAGRQLPLEQAIDDALQSD